MAKSTESIKADSFERAAMPHLDAAYNLARWLVPNNQDAEDIVQEAFLRAFRFFDGFHGGNARAWLMAIVRNTAYTWLQQYRELNNSQSFDDVSDNLEGLTSATMLTNPDSNPETLLSRADDREQLNRAMERLPTEFREVLVLRELEGFSYKEISTIAAIPIGTVMSRLARGRNLLWKSLKEASTESSDGL